MSEENNDTQQVVYIFTTNITPINLVIAAAFVLFASYKMLFHRSGPAAGLTAAFDGLLWLMREIRTITLGSSAKDVTYGLSTAARCLMIKDDQICIIYVKKGNYYKLPRGGVEPEGPNHTIACQSSALKETGCEVIVHPKAFAHTIEYRGALHQESHANVCTVGKDTGKVELPELEADEGLEQLWCPITEALQKMNAVKPTTELDDFAKKRDIFPLERYLRT